MVLRGLDLAGQSWNFSRSSSLAYIFLAVPDGPLFSPAYVAAPSCAIDSAAGHGVPPIQKDGLPSTREAALTTPKARFARPCGSDRSVRTSRARGTIRTVVASVSHKEVAVTPDRPEPVRAGVLQSAGDC